MKKKPSPPQELSAEELLAILDHAKTEALSEAEHAKLKAAVDTLAFLTQELQSKRVSIDRLRRLLFGAPTEKTEDVLGEDVQGSEKKEPGAGEKKKRPGHGRNGASAFTGAKRVRTAHPSLAPGQQCPCCERGRVYVMAEPERLVRITGMAPLGATVYEQEKLRCNGCGEVFTAPAPAGVGEEKYDETATAMVAMLKYGAGMPFYRTERLQKSMGIPLPAATQWELVRDGAKELVDVHEALVRQAAQGEVLYNDDTTMKVLSLTPEERARAADDKQTDGRKGVFTSGIVATGEGKKIALFFTGVKHAGENLTDVLARRVAELPPPIQMCDALSRNTPDELKIILANCLAHARRRFVDVVNDFPEECRFVLETLRDVYKHDAESRGMRADERLLHHQGKSKPLMEALEKWLAEQFDEHKVEPNSALGEAIGYMRKHWHELTLFLREPGAPLDNNLCERALKKAILHRKNAMFYKTLEGARAGDTYMSLIHTCELNGITPFEYLVAVQRHAAAASREPAAWMPWNYTEAIARLGPAPPA